MRVLIVDDDLVDRQIVKRALHLGSVSYELVEAETVDEGLEKFEHGDFDLVLVDYRMPGRDGIEFVMAVHEGYKNKVSAVVMMSNSEDEQIALDAIRAGAQDFILKPEINGPRLRRSILHAQTRFDLEKQLQDTHAKLKHLAERDSLTGLANRYLFDESLKVSVANNRRESHKLALLLIDLDNFKYVNDNFGHDVGDILLQRVVQRVHACLRGNEMFARLGGDEFSITLANLVDAREASKVAQRILLVLEKPFEIDGRTIVSGASIGIAINPENGKTPEDLLKNADIAMYRAKKQGRNQACFFEEEMQDRFSSRFEIEQELREAMIKNQFSLRYQPVYSARTHQLGGFEVLLRWCDENGDRATRSYLDIAEESKLIVQIGRWAIERAIRQQVEWSRMSGIDLEMSINLSPSQLSDRSLVPLLKKLFKEHSAKPSAFVFEVTEQALHGPKKERLDLIQSLRTLGCKVALDDFGSGASSVGSLRDYPFDLVKIDPSFLPTENSPDQERRLFSSVVGMIQALELKTVVVGTESVEQVELCCGLNVDQLQGHFFSKPESVDYIEENLLKRAPSGASHL